MKKEIFRFLYENEGGRDDHFNLPICYDDSQGIDLGAHVRSCGEDYMRANALSGTLYEAHSTERELFFRYGNHPQARQWWYTGKFMRVAPDGTFDRTAAQICYTAVRPIVINRLVIEDMIAKIADSHGNTHGYQLVGIGLDENKNGVEDATPPQADPEESHDNAPVPKWIRVKDNAGIFSWIPGLIYPDGRVRTVLGDLKDPDSPDDTRDFDNSPFEGYTIIKEK